MKWSQKSKSVIENTNCGVLCVGVGFLGFEVPLFLGDHNVTFVGCGCFEKSRLLTPSPSITPYVEDL